MNSTMNPSYTIEDGELTPPPTRESSYDAEHTLFFDEEKRQSIETINLDIQSTTSNTTTIIPNFLSYIHSIHDQAAIFNLLIKLANNRIQFTFQSGSAIFNLKYLQEISTYTTEKTTNLSFSALENSFVFQDELDEIFKLGNKYSCKLASDFETLNKQAIAIPEHVTNEAVVNLKEYIKNIAKHMKVQVNKQFSNGARNSVDFFKNYSTVSNNAAKEPLVNNTASPIDISMVESSKSQSKYDNSLFSQLFQCCSPESSSKINNSGEKRKYTR